MSLLDEGLAWRHPGDYVRLQQAAFRAEMRAAFTVRQPTSFMLITGEDGVYNRVTVEGHAERPINLGRLYTRHMRGVIEMERHQRREAKK